MPPEAWVALILGLVTIFITTLGAAWWISSQFTATTTGLTSLDEKVDDMKKTVDKMEETLQTVATQKEQIQSLREAVTQNTSRTDKTFERVFAMIDQLRSSRPSGNI